MDLPTLNAYNLGAGDYASEWDEQPSPADLYALVTDYFRPGATADVGCGAGRDTAWLADAGFDARGYDGSPALVAEAMRRHPALSFGVATLPALEEVTTANFANVLCETVIMHLEEGDVAVATRRLVELLAPGGTLLLTWRVSEDTARDERGRLYSSFPTELVLDSLEAMAVLLDEQATNASSGRRVHRVIARREP